LYIEIRAHNKTKSNNNGAAEKGKKGTGSKKRACMPRMNEDTRT